MLSLYYAFINNNNYNVLGASKKGPGKSTVLTGKKVKSKKQQQAYERYKKGEEINEEEQVCLLFSFCFL